MTTTPEHDVRPTDSHPTDTHPVDKQSVDKHVDSRVGGTAVPDTRTARADQGRIRTDGQDPVAETTVIPTRRDVIAAQRERYGRIKWGSAFFGWLAAVGTAVLLSAVAALVGLASGAALAPESVGRAVGEVGAGAQPVSSGLVGVGVLAVVIFLAFYCGGYVAGRMARFGGIKQGVAVWLWAIVATIVLSLVGVAAGGRLSAIAAVNGLPLLALGQVLGSPAGVVAVVVALVVALLGAVLGGLGGMVFHRRVDRAGLSS